MMAILRPCYGLLPQSTSDRLTDAGLLLLRVSFGLSLALGHGWQKLTHFGEMSAGFPDPVGLGSALGLGLMTFAEFFCSLAVVAGLATRLAAIPPIIGLGVALTVFHAADPWQKKELAFIYLLAYSTIVVAGPGRFSLDSLIANPVRRRRSEPTVCADG